MREPDSSQVGHVDVPKGPVEQRPMQPSLAELALNTEFTKYTILIVSAPLWWPFLRELYKEFNDILAEEGGLLGRKPTEKELAQIRRRRAISEATLVRELREEQSGPRGGRSLARGAFGSSAPRRGGDAGARTRRGGFGPPR
jgi:hypothetical protein